jgi:hypothetical protein
MGIAGLLGNATSKLGIFGGGFANPLSSGKGLVTSKPSGAKFLRTLEHADFKTADFLCVASVWNEIGSFTVGAQQFATFGQGAIGTPSEQVGRVAVDIENTSGTDYDGLVRFAIQNAQGTQEVVVMEERTEKLSENLTDMTKWVVMPESTVWASEDSKLVLKFKPATADTVDYGETTAHIPVTIYQ